MTRIDRYILLRFLTNFVIMFALTYFFAVAIDLMIALDEFVKAARMAVGEDAGRLAELWMLVKLAVNFQGPRLFQFFGYLSGLIAVGAMGFTLAQMYRGRELTALLSAGISMPRLAMPFVVASFGLSVLQLVNHELILPRVAPLLLRDHGQIGKRGVDDFPVSLTPDAAGNLFQAPRYEPDRNALHGLTILERDDRGRTVRRVTAEVATWQPEGPDGAGWRLESGRSVTLRDPEAGSGGGDRLVEAAGFYATNLSPQLLTVKRHGQFVAMLSLRQIGEMLESTDASERSLLLRYRYGRFAMVLVNVLVMWITLPTFLLREPANLLRRAMLCAAIAIPGMLGSAIFMLVDLPGIAPAVGVFLPVVVLIPVVLGQWTFIKT